MILCKTASMTRRQLCKTLTAIGWGKTDLPEKERGMSSRTISITRHSEEHSTYALLYIKIGR